MDLDALQREIGSGPAPSDDEEHDEYDSYSRYNSSYDDEDEDANRR
jgi:hypothetical protein